MDGLSKLVRIGERLGARKIPRAPCCREPSPECREILAEGLTLIARGNIVIARMSELARYAQTESLWNIGLSLGDRNGLRQGFEALVEPLDRGPRILAQSPARRRHSDKGITVAVASDPRIEADWWAHPDRLLGIVTRQGSFQQFAELRRTVEQRLAKKKRHPG